MYREDDVELRIRTRLQLLNNFSVFIDSRPVRLIHSSCRLVAFLGLNGEVTRTFVAGSLWPDSDEWHAQAQLRSTLWRLLRSSRLLVVSDGATIRLNDYAQVDTRELERLCWRLDDDAYQPADDLAWLPPRGVLLPGWYDDWVLLARERIRQQHLHALEALAERYLRRGCHSRALDLALTVAEHEPFRESAQRLIAEIHLAEGNAAEALSGVEAFSGLLWRTMQVRPSSTLLELAEGLSAHVT